MLGWASAPPTPGTCRSRSLRDRGLSPPRTLPPPPGGPPHSGPAHILAVLQKDKEVVVLPQGGVGRQALQKDFVHSNCLLKDRQVLPAEGSRQLKGPPRF